MLERVLGIGKTGNRFVDRNKGIVMETYDLKDSGIDCLGNIPKHWVKGKIKNRFFLKPSNVDKKSYDDEISVELCNYVDVYYNDFITNDLAFMSATATDYEIKKFSLNIDDVLITKDSEDPMDIGVPALVKEIKPNLVCGYHLTMLRRRPCHVSGSFLFWALKDEAIASQLYREATGVTRWAISSRNIKNVAIAYPDLNEQKAIADYLDKACQNIDKTITLKQQQLDKLEAYRKSLIHEAVTKGLDKTVPMKDSGVEWLGEIPEHWKSDRLKDFVIFNPTKNPARIKENEVVSIFPMEFISENGEILGRNEAIYKETDTGLNYFENGDVIFAKITPCMENGKGALIKDIPTRISLGSTEFFVLRPTFLVNAEYLYYLTRNQYFRDFLEKNMKGAAGQQRVPAKFFKYTVLPLPNIEEQKTIADYLDKACTNIDKTKETIAKQIKTLTQYRQSLIHECVTGKKRVYQSTN